MINRILIDSCFSTKKALIEIGFVLIIFFVAVCVFNYIRVLFIEKKIKEKHRNLKQAIKKEESRLASMEAMHPRIKYLRDKDRPEIEELERKREFIVEKIRLISESNATILAFYAKSVKLDSYEKLSKIKYE